MSKDEATAKPASRQNGALPSLLMKPESLRYLRPLFGGAYPPASQPGQPQNSWTPIIWYFPDLHLLSSWMLASRRNSKGQSEGTIARPHANLRKSPPLRLSASGRGIGRRNQTCHWGSVAAHQVNSQQLTRHTSARRKRRFRLEVSHGFLACLSSSCPGCTGGTISQSPWPHLSSTPSVAALVMNSVLRKVPLALPPTSRPLALRI
jgi:hypothetical protein